MPREITCVIVTPRSAAGSAYWPWAFPLSRLASFAACSLSVLRIQQRQREPHSPLRAVVGCVGEVAEAARKADRLLTDLADLAVCEDQRHGPLPRLPVVARFAVERNCPALADRLREKRLQEQRAHVAPVAVAGERPDLVDQRAVRPAALGLLERYPRRARAPFAGAEQIVARERQRQSRADAPDPARLRVRLRREEQTLEHVADTELA